jgi:hypothetical protein
MKEREERKREGREEGRRGRKREGGRKTEEEGDSINQFSRLWTCGRHIIGPSNKNVGLPFLDPPGNDSFATAHCRCT